MKINIYYGGRGLIDDPTLYVINKMQEILEELNVIVERYVLHELKNTITTLPQTLKTADGIILATTIEWYGIGGYMQQFLDACWLYGDKEKISQIYMSPIVMATTYGEREGKLNLETAWEILGGKPCTGICGYIADTVMLELKGEYNRLIEKKAENMYRTINQKTATLPASNQAVKQMVTITQNTDLTQQETEQLSQYASNDEYVQKQREDIQELADLFKEKLVGTEAEDYEQFISELEEEFKPQIDFSATYKIQLHDKKKPLVIRVNERNLKCEYTNIDKADVEIGIESNIMRDIMCGRMTFQRAFMSGSMTMKGDFQALKTLDRMFPFMEVK
ncbi:MAG: SCP2 sterol-binding domain-containing protein [Eubacteriales bacterium]